MKKPGGAEGGGGGGGEAGYSHELLHLLCRLALDVDACRPRESGCPPQLLQVAIELFPQWRRFWSHVPLQSVM